MVGDLRAGSANLMHSPERESFDAPEQRRLAGEDAPAWLATCFALVGTTIALAAASMWASEWPALEQQGFRTPTISGPEQDATLQSTEATPLQPADSIPAPPAPSPSPAAEAIHGERAASVPAADAATAQTAPSADQSPSTAVDCLPVVSISFARDSARPNWVGLEEQVAPLRQWMTRYPDAILSVEGHTDPTGPEQYNVLLSYSRAKAVIARLVASGLSERQMIIRASGANRPKGVATGADDNRRVLLQVEGVAVCRETRNTTEEQ